MNKNYSQLVSGVTMTRYLPRPAPLALALSLMFGGSAVWAQSPANLAPAAAPLDISIPTQPLGDALNAWARQTGTQIAVQQSLVMGKSAPAVSGRLTPRQALDRLLAGSGLVGVADGGAVVIRLTPVASTSESVLPTVTVSASAEPLPGELPKPFAGGQVARGARVGVLGNGDFMETPFNIIAFTEEFKQNLQARRLGDVLQYSVSAQTPQSTPGNANEIVILRGFVAPTAAATVDGLPGLLSRLPPANFTERIEVLLGANTFVNGAAGGDVGLGGSINLVPKRAADSPLTRLGLTYESNNLWGMTADVGRRFGQDNVWGIRASGAVADGNTEVRHGYRSPADGSVAIDYRGERLRASLDVLESRPDQGFETYVNFGQRVRTAPSGRRLYSVPDTRSEADFGLTIGRLEWDLAPNWTLAGAYGEANFRSYTRFAGYTLADDAGTLTGGYAGQGSELTDKNSAMLSIKGAFRTGSVSHSVNAGVSRFENEYRYGGYESVGLPDANLFAPNPAQMPDLLGFNLPPGPMSRDKTTGVFVGDQLGFLDDKLLLTVGIRRVGIEQESLDGETGLASAPRYKKSATTPAVGLLYKLTPAFSVYANRVEGLGSGAIVGNNSAGLPYSNAGQSLPATKNKQLEVGFKKDFDGYAVTLSLFEIQRVYELEDTASNTLAQNGLQRNRGAELSVFGELAKGLRLYSGLSLLDAKIERSQGGTLDGKQPSGVPKLSLAASVDWDVPGAPGLALTGGVIHTGASQLDAANTIKVKASTRLDAGLRYRTRIAGKDTVFRFNVENLADKGYLLNDRGYLSVAPPRTFLASLTTDF